MVTAASTVSITGIGFLAIALIVVLGSASFALRSHNRMFPKGWDRTGWTPEPGKARRFETMFTWLSGGRGP